MNKTNKKWIELSTLQRQLECDLTNGASDVALDQMRHKIEVLKGNIQREALSQSDEQDDVDRKNRQRLVELMLTHNITIPARDFDKWRPTTLTRGRIEGVADGLTCIMTNGLLGYFLRDEGEPLYGHMSHFMWDTPVVSYIPYLTEQGEERYFKSEKDQGVPSTYFRKEPKPKPPKVKKAPKRSPEAIRRANILANL
jgi:hypothetical protein